MTPDWQPSAAELKAQDRVIWRIIIAAQAVAVAMAAITGWWWALAVEGVALLWMWVKSKL